jgi:hypothetical protein
MAYRYLWFAVDHYCDKNQQEPSSVPRCLAAKLTTVNAKGKAKTGKPFSVADFPIETVSSDYNTYNCTVLTCVATRLPLVVKRELQSCILELD